MKLQKIILIFLSINLALVAMGSFSKTVEGTGAKLEFVGEPTYECYKKSDAGYYYHVYMAIKNSADVSSCPIDIRIFEDGKSSVTDKNTCLGVIFKPYEEKEFTIEWLTPHSEKEIDIKYKASDIENITLDNTGSKTINVIYKPESDNSTPGFGIVFLLFSSIIFILIKKKKK